jgi:hypothetical protein
MLGIKVAVAFGYPGDYTGSFLAAGYAKQGISAAQRWPRLHRLPL